MDSYDYLEQIHLIIHKALAQRDFENDERRKALPILTFPPTNEQLPAKAQGAETLSPHNSDVGIVEPDPIEKENKGIIEFTEKEILKMPKAYRRYFRIDGIKVPYRKKKNGVYELRCMINKEPFYDASVDLKKAKQRFIEALRNGKSAKSDSAESEHA